MWRRASARSVAAGMTFVSGARHRPGRMLELGFLRRQPVVSELKNDLASLRLNEAPEKSREGPVDLPGHHPAGRRRRASTRWRSTGGFSKVEVATVTPTVEQVGSAAAGTPVLTASGYLVARREAVVSSKIQGRLLESAASRKAARSKTGEILAKLESADYEAQLARADAQLKQAEAAHRLVGRRHSSRRGRPGRGERQLSVTRGSTPTSSCPWTRSTPSKSRVRLAEAALAAVEGRSRSVGRRVRAVGGRRHLRRSAVEQHDHPRAVCSAPS